MPEDMLKWEIGWFGLKINVRELWRRYVKPLIPSRASGLRLPYTRRSLIKSLRRKYRETRFYIADTQESFYETIAEVLISIIQAKRTAKEADGSPRLQPVRVGIVCGPMVFRTAQHIIDTKLLAATANYANVSFVAMNRAAESDSFQFSASYLATLLSTAFPNSKAVAYTFNTYDIDAINSARNAVDILLCSAGTYPNVPEGYVQIWCKKALTGRSTSQTLPTNCIGDFCLIPIDAEGCVVGDDVLIKKLHEEIDPFPLFARLADLKGKSTVVLPINIERKSEHAGRGPGNGGGLTGKETVAKTVLHSGIVDVCVLERALAKNLAAALGDYVLATVSKPVPNEPMRFCRAYHFRDFAGLRDFYVYDPLSRIDAVCEIRQQDRPKPCSLSVIPQIIISESQKESERYDFKKKSGFFDYCLDGGEHAFAVDKGVRKPGQFSLVTLQLVSGFVEEIGIRGKASVWDLGCGSGFVGILAAKLLGDRVERVLCSDIRPEAVNCTQHNVRNNGLDECRVQVCVGDLFETRAADAPFDVIAFNAPFLPEALPDHAPLDCGGRRGTAESLRFCSEARKHLRQGGWAILAVADYVDDGSIRKALEQKFGRQNVHMEERLILYPFKPLDRIPLAHEVECRDELERQFGYRFEICRLGSEEFLAFNMRHYCAKHVG
jgi:methylase of polypeptide subunit release factors